MAFDASGDDDGNALRAEGYLTAVERVVRMAELWAMQLAWADYMTSHQRRNEIRTAIAWREAACTLLEEYQWEAEDQAIVDDLKARLRKLKARQI